MLVDFKNILGKVLNIQGLGIIFLPILVALLLLRIVSPEAIIVIFTEIFIIILLVSLIIAQGDTKKNSNKIKSAEKN